MTRPNSTPAQTRWKTTNTWAGYLVFGLPAALAIPALAATFAKFGVRDTVPSAVPAAVWVCIPVLVWARYTRRPPQTRTGSFTWAVLALAAIATLVFSPLSFWAPAAAVVLTSETLRLLLSRRSTLAWAGVRAVRTKVRGLLVRSIR